MQICLLKAIQNGPTQSRFPNGLLALSALKDVDRLLDIPPIFYNLGEFIMSKVAFIKKLSGYFLCAFLLMSGSAKSAIAPSPTALRAIYIYNDKGASQTGIKNCKDAISALDPQLYVVKEINAEQTISGEWRKDAAAFIMPGGADLPYCKKLNGAGNVQIIEYVEAGGTYYDDPYKLDQ